MTTKKPAAAVPAGVGRPSKFKPEFIEQAEKLCRLGATDVEVADFFQITTVTLWRWKNQSQEFCNALKPGKNLADDRVERSLYHRAVGYDCEEVDVRVIKGKIVTTTVRKRHPPDVVACIFWLKNRRPDQWRADPDGAGGALPGGGVVERFKMVIREES